MSIEGGGRLCVIDGGFFIGDGESLLDVAPRPAEWTERKDPSATPELFFVGDGDGGRPRLYVGVTNPLCTTLLFSLPPFFEVGLR